MKFVILALIIMTSFLARAEDSTAEPKALTLTRTCTNKAQALDAAPIAAVFQDSAKNNFVMLQGRGYTKYIPVHLTKRAIIDGAIYENADGSTTLTETNGVEEPPAKTTVEFGDLTYDCSANNAAN